jgi:hypothetical protein
MHDAMAVALRRCRTLLSTAAQEALRDYPDIYPEFSARTLIERDLRYHLLEMKDVVMRDLPNEIIFKTEEN